MTPLTSTAGLEPGDLLRFDRTGGVYVLTAVERDGILRFADWRMHSDRFTFIGRPAANGWMIANGVDLTGLSVEFESHPDGLHFRLATPEPVSKSAETEQGYLVAVAWRNRHHTETAWRASDRDLSHDPYILSEPLVRKADAEAEIARLHAEVEGLREAFEPFAVAAEALDEDHADASPIWETSSAMCIDAGNLRLAARLSTKREG